MALRITPSNTITSNGGTITGNTNFPNGINVYSETVASNIQNNDVRYYKLARVRFSSTTSNPNGTFCRALFNIKVYHTGTNLKIGNIKGYFYNGPTKRSIHSTSFLMVINNSGSTGFSSGDVSYVPLDSGSNNDDYIVDIYINVGNYATLYENTDSATFENSATLILKPDGSTLVTSLPVAGTTTTIGGVVYTYGTFVNGVITSDLNSQTATIDNAIPKFSGTTGQLVGSQKLSINASDQLVSTVTSGAGSPFVVASTARVDNLNVAQLNGISDTGFLKTATTSALNNNIAIQAKETGGTNRDVVKLDGSNVLQIGNSSNANFINGTSTTLNNLAIGDLRHCVKFIGGINWNNNVSNEKIDIEIGNINIIGTITLRISAGFNNILANGIIEKRIDIVASTNGTITWQQGNYTYISNKTKDMIAISDVIWDATKSKFIIKICKLTSLSSSIVIEVESFSINNSSPAINYSVSSIYTTDTTIYPTATLQSQGLNIVTTVTGTAAPTTTPTFVGQQFVDTINKKIYVATGTTNSSDWTILN